MTVAIGCKSFKLIILLNIFVVSVPSSRLPHWSTAITVLAGTTMVTAVFNGVPATFAAACSWQHWSQVARISVHKLATHIGPWSHINSEIAAIRHQCCVSSTWQRQENLPWFAFIIHHSSAFCERQLFHLLNRFFKLEPSCPLSPQLQAEKVLTGSDHINNARWDVSVFSRIQNDSNHS